VFTANSYGYKVELDLIQANVKVAAIVDLRQTAETSEYSHALLAQGITVYQASCVYEVIPTRDRLGIKAVVICDYDERLNQANPRSKITVPCDGVTMSAGWAGASGLLYQAGTSMRYDQSVEQFVPHKLPAGVFAAGKVNGVFDLDSRLLDGARAANEAMAYLGLPAIEIGVGPHTGSSPSHSYPVVGHPKGKNFVDFDEDLTLKDFFNAAQEGFNNIELIKRFTTVGMGPSQGKHSNMNAIRILARIRNLPVEKVGTTTSRPFFHPTPIGHLAGRSFHPHRHTAIHQWHQGAEAVLTTVGAWQRPAYYQKAGLKASDIIQQEVLAVRKSAGLIDSSTLGKIEICGPDAAEFLERFYTGSFANQATGKSRYALLLDESGVVIDDGVVARLSEDSFYATTSTANAAAVYREMQRWQQIWQLDIGLINVTSAYAAMNLAGPMSRTILSSICSLDLSDDAFPAGELREGTIVDIAVRIMRVAFVAELAYEIHVSSDNALNLWQSIISAGKPHGLRPFGTEAQRVLRLEMGHLIVGHDTDGLTNPLEINAEWALKMEKPFFIGQRSLQILQKKSLQKRLVPFVLTSKELTEMPKDCNLVIAQGEIKGRVTSIAYSPTLNKVIGLAFLSPQMVKKDHAFEIRCDSGAMVQAQVTATPFIEVEMSHD
ncbi:MAG: glycine cleavage T C-terminal barrel domain-containing protein, partial [Methylophilaceae bacterium]|nr:glycine cleavage T C-terminal barrel domain-containing protein [Methylophilaceae bacterium]